MHTVHENNMPTPTPMPAPIPEPVPEPVPVSENTDVSAATAEAILDAETVAEVVEAFNAPEVPGLAEDGTMSAELFEYIVEQAEAEAKEATEIISADDVPAGEPPEADEGVVDDDDEVEDAPAHDAQAQDTPGEAPVAVGPPTLPELTALVESLKAQLAGISGRRGGNTKKKTVANPSNFYVLRPEPVVFHKTPQVAALQKIITSPKFFKEYVKAADGTVTVSEASLFDAISKGAEAGILRTRQTPVRILKYYKSDLIAAGSLRGPLGAEK